MHFLHREIHPSCWGITLADLRFFEREVRRHWVNGQIPDNPDFPNALHNDPKIGPNIYQVNEHYIKPVTLAHGGMSWALMQRPGGLKCDFFVTHCWAEGVFEFCGKIRRNWPRDGRSLWCCFLALPQNADISSVLGTHLMATPFAQALATCQHFMVVPNSRVSIYSRLWCVFEAHIALERGIPITLPQQPRIWEAVRLSAGWVTLFVLAVVYGYVGIPVEASRWFFLHVFPFLVVVCSVALLFDHLSDSPNVVTVYLRALIIGIMLGMVLIGEVEQLEFRVVHMRLILMIPITAGWLYSNIHALVVNTLMNESSELNFDSVRQARCSHVADEVAIRQAIAGTEDEIDAAISALMIVGSYNPMVKRNLMRGLSPRRIKRGNRWGMVVSYGTFLVVFPFTCSFYGDVYLGRFTLIAAVLVSITLMFIPRLQASAMIFAGDVVISGGLFLYTVLELLGFVWAGRATNPFHCQIVHTGLHHVLYATTILGIVAVIVLFYSGWLTPGMRPVGCETSGDEGGIATGSDCVCSVRSLSDSDEEEGSPGCNQLTTCN